MKRWSSLSLELEIQIDLSCSKMSNMAELNQFWKGEYSSTTMCKTYCQWSQMFDCSFCRQGWYNHLLGLQLLFHVGQGRLVQIFSLNKWKVSFNILLLQYGYLNHFTIFSQHCICTYKNNSNLSIIFKSYCHINFSLELATYFMIWYSLMAKSNRCAPVYKIHCIHSVIDHSCVIN